MKQLLLLYVYFVVVQSAVQLNSPYLIDEFSQTTSSNPYIDDSQTVSVIVGNGGYQPAYDPSTIPNWRKDIVGLWHLDETSGTSLTDSSIKGETASLVSGTLSTGRFGGGILLDGIGYVRIPNDPFRADQPQKGFTAAAWVNFKSFSQEALLWERLYNNYEVDLTSSGYLQFLAAGTDFYPGDAWNAASLKNTWAHVGCVYEPTTKSMKLYVNGAVKATNVINGFTSFRHGDYTEIYLGRRPPQFSPGLGLNGTIDEFTIWSKALTAADFSSLYSQSAATSPSNGISFTSQDLVLPTAMEASDIIASWQESVPGALEMLISTDKGNTWCSAQNGVPLGRNQTDCLFPTVNFKYRVRWNSVFSTIQSLNVSFIPGPLPLTGIRPVPVGINLGAVTYWAESWDFIDYMKFGGGVLFPPNAKVNSTTGYPTSYVAGLDSYLPIPQTRDYIAGQKYTLIMKGKGKVSLRYAPGNINFDSPGTYQISMPYPDQPIGIRIEQTDAVDPIYSIQVLHPGYTEADVAVNPFHPTFLDRLSSFTSLRFMDYGLTNGNNLVEWKNRNIPASIGQFIYTTIIRNITSITFPFGAGGTPFTNQFACLVVTQSAHGLSTGQLVSVTGTNAWVNWAATDGSSSGKSYLNVVNAMVETIDATSFYMTYSLDWWWSPTSVQITGYGSGTNGTMTLQIQAGVALEHMVQLSNQLQADGWFCIPHLASDDYVTKMASLIATTLSPNLKATFEYSNELWNTMFSQSTYSEKMANKLGITKAQWIAKRTAQVFAIVDAQFAAAGASSRLVKVIGSQASNSDWSNQLLTAWSSATYNPTHVQAQALAIAPYFGNDIPGNLVTTGQLATATVDDVIDQCRPALRFDSYSWMLTSKQVADSFGVGMVSYEGGQHLVGVYGDVDNDALTNLLTTTNRNQRMSGLYDEMFRLWSSVGGGTFNIFAFVGSYSKWGSWGILEYQQQDPATAYKYQTVTRWADYNAGVAPSPSPVAGSPSVTPSRTPSPASAASVTPTPTPTRTPSPAAASPSVTPSRTPSPSAVVASSSVTPSRTPSTSAVASVSVTPTRTPSPAAPSSSVTPTATPSTSSVASVSVTPTVTPSVSSVASSSVTPSRTPSAAAASSSVTPSASSVASVSVTPTATPSRTPSAAAASSSATPSASSVASASVTPSRTPSGSPTPSSSTASSSSSGTPTSSPSNLFVSPTRTPSRTASPSKTPRRKSPSPVAGNLSDGSSVTASFITFVGVLAMILL